MSLGRYPHDPKRPAPKAVQEAVANGDMEAVGKLLTPRQKAFCHEFVVDKKKMAAAIRAGYSPKNAEQQATNLFMNVGVRAYIEHLSLSSAAKIMSVDPDYVIQEVTRIIREADKDSDKLRGLELIARHLGMFVDKTEITGKDGGPIETETRRVKEEADAFTHQLQQLTHRSDSKHTVN